MNIIPGGVTVSKLFFNRAKQIFVEFLQSTGKSEKTQKVRLQTISYFRRYMSTTRLRDLREVKETYLVNFTAWLEKQVVRQTGRPFSPSMKTAILVSVKQLFHSLYIAGLMLTNPARSLELPKQQYKQKVILKHQEMEKLLDSIIRPVDRALFELMYSSALRVGEVVRLKIGDLDFNRKQVRVRKSKFGKDRVVPVNGVALEWVRGYLKERPGSEGLLFLGQGKENRINGNTINYRFKEYAEQAGVMKRGLSCHSIRHSCATHLLEAGADFRYVSQLLGHSKLESTAVYTGNLESSLKRMYRSFHPGENLFYREVADTYLERLIHLSVNKRQ